MFECVLEIESVCVSMCVRERESVRECVTKIKRERGERLSGRLFRREIKVANVIKKEGTK